MWSNRANGLPCALFWAPRHEQSSGMFPRLMFRESIPLPLPSAPLRRAEPRPVAERAGKCVRIGITQRRGDLPYRKIGVVEKLPGQLESGRVEELLQTLAVFFKASPQRPLADPEHARDRIGRRGAAQYHLMQHALYLLRETHRFVGLRFPHRFDEEAMERGVCAVDWGLEPGGGEQDPGDFGVEAHARSEQPAVGFGVAWRAVGELDAQRRPRGAAQLAQYLVSDRDRRVVDVRGRRRAVAIDRIAENDAGGESNDSSSCDCGTVGNYTEPRFIPLLVSVF